MSHLVVPEVEYPSDGEEEEEEEEGRRRISEEEERNRHVASCGS